MGVAEVEDHARAFALGAIPNPDDVEILRPTLRHAGDGIRQQCANEAMEGASLALVIGAGDVEVPVRYRRRDPVQEAHLEHSLRPFDLDEVTGELYIDSLGQGDRHFSNP